MNKLILGAALCALAGTLTLAAPSQDRDEHRDHGRDEHHDNGKHKGWDKHEGGDEDRHDNGKHKGWEKHEVRENHRDWDDDHDRIRPRRAYPFGRYEHVRSVFISHRIDYRTRPVVLYDTSNC